jgi:hypothetical protein
MGEIAIDVAPLADPLPASAAVCGLVFALSVTVSVPRRSPPAAGVKVTSIVQALLLPTELQVFVCAKSPVVVMPEIVIADGK